MAITSAGSGRSVGGGGLGRRRVWGDGGGEGRGAGRKRARLFQTAVAYERKKIPMSFAEAWYLRSMHQ